MANDEMTTLSVAETDNDPQKNAQALERLLQSMFDASNQIVRDAGTRFETLIRDWFLPTRIIFPKFRPGRIGQTSIRT